MRVISFEKMSKEWVDKMLSDIKARDFKIDGYVEQVGQKSLYWEHEWSGMGRALVSYGTPIIIILGEFAIFSKVSYSPTTSKHFNEYHGLYRRVMQQVTCDDFIKLCDALGLSKGRAGWHRGDYYPSVTKRWVEVK